MPGKNYGEENHGRASREVAHGKHLSDGDSEAFWGWGTPAGRKRAERRAELISKHAGLKPGMRIIEIGCGTGMFTEMFSEYGAHITAIDISNDLLEKARGRNISGDKAVFLNARFEDVSLPGNVDAIIGSSVLHHLDIVAAFARIFELLKPGGAMSFAEPNMLNPQVFAERRFRSLFPHVSPDETAFVRWSLSKTIREAGFINVGVKPFDWLHPSIPKSFISVASAVGGILEKTPLFKEFSGSLIISAVKPSS